MVKINIRQMKKDCILVLDIDGTLTDSVSMHQEALLGAMQALNLARLNTDWGSYRMAVPVDRPSILLRRKRASFAPGMACLDDPRPTTVQPASSDQIYVGAFFSPLILCIDLISSAWDRRSVPKR